jgi:hypothetical protein
VNWLVPATGSISTFAWKCRLHGAPPGGTFAMGQTDQDIALNGGNRIGQDLLLPASAMDETEIFANNEYQFVDAIADLLTLAKNTG